MSYQSTASKWTDDEKKYVLKKFKEGMTPEQIQKTGKINRSALGIKLKIYNIIYDQLQNGDSYDDLANEYKKTPDDIKEIEKEAFKKKHEYSAQQTSYTNDGGYTMSASSTTSSLDLSEFHNINRTMNTVLHFYENISRLNKLKQEKIIDDDFYNALIKQLNEFKFDKDKIISNIDVKNMTPSSVSTTKKNNNTSTDEKKSSKKNTDKSSKKKDESDDDSVEIEIPIKKLKKRII